ncbi:HK97 gp10 family phage protein [uncultured Friedmanniella sp.]|uniref:HK97 gp10 family phage protein n=1 Tax=uncultured Friedmanniella sp. TaxID=335381 RepID=UPI0035CCA3C1
MDVRVTGADEVARQLSRLAADAERLDLSAAGDPVREALADASPRRTGALAASWVATAGNAKVQVGSDLVYAPIQNYGSSHVPALHYVERAAELPTDEAGRLVTAEIDRLISRL